MWNPSICGKDVKYYEPLNVYGGEIGNRCMIGAFVEIGPEVVIGDDCRIQSGAFIPQGVVIGDSVFIGPNVVFTNVKKPKAKVKQFFQKTIVGNGTVIGANATILPGIIIGNFSTIGAGAIVTKNVPPHSIVISPEAKIIKSALQNKS